MCSALIYTGTCVALINIGADWKYNLFKCCTEHFSVDTCNSVYLWISADEYCMYMIVC